MVKKYGKNSNANGPATAVFRNAPKELVFREVKLDPSELVSNRFGCAAPVSFKVCENFYRRYDVPYFSPNHVSVKSVNDSGVKGPILVWNGTVAYFDVRDVDNHSVYKQKLVKYYRKIKPVLFVPDKVFDANHYQISKRMHVVMQKRLEFSDKKIRSYSLKDKQRFLKFVSSVTKRTRNLELERLLVSFGVGREDIIIRDGKYLLGPGVEFDGDQEKVEFLTGLERVNEIAPAGDQNGQCYKTYAEAYAVLPPPPPPSRPPPSVPRVGFDFANYEQSKPFLTRVNDKINWDDGNIFGLATLMGLPVCLQLSDLYELLLVKVPGLYASAIDGSMRGYTYHVLQIFNIVGRLCGMDYHHVGSFIGQFINDLSNFVIFGVYHLIAELVDMCGFKYIRVGAIRKLYDGADLVFSTCGNWLDALISRWEDDPVDNGVTQVSSVGAITSIIGKVLKMIAPTTFDGFVSSSFFERLNNLTATVMLAPFTYLVPGFEFKRLESWMREKHFDLSSIDSTVALVCDFFLNILPAAMTGDWSATKRGVELDGWTLKCNRLMTISSVATARQYAADYHKTNYSCLLWDLGFVESDIRSCLIEGKKLQGIVYGERNPAAKIVVDRNIASLIALQALVSSYNSQAKLKPAPFCVQVYGKPGCGKTWLVEQVLRVIGVVMDFDGDPALEAWNMNYEKFETSYNGQPFMRLDDWCQYDPDDLDLTTRQAVFARQTNTPYISPQASVENKGVVIDRVRAIVCGSNQVDMNLRGMQVDMTAMLRRWPIRITVLKYEPAEGADQRNAYKLDLHWRHIVNGALVEDLLAHDVGWSAIAGVLQIKCKEFCDEQKRYIDSVTGFQLRCTHHKLTEYCQICVDDAILNIDVPGTAWLRALYCQENCDQCRLEPHVLHARPGYRSSVVERTYHQLVRADHGGNLLFYLGDIFYDRIMSPDRRWLMLWSCGFVPLIEEVCVRNFIYQFIYCCFGDRFNYLLSGLLFSFLELMARFVLIPDISWTCILICALHIYLSFQYLFVRLFLHVCYNMYVYSFVNEPPPIPVYAISFYDCVVSFIIRCRWSYYLFAVPVSVIPTDVSERLHRRWLEGIHLIATDYVSSNVSWLVSHFSMTLGMGIGGMAVACLYALSKGTYKVSSVVMGETPTTADLSVDDKIKLILKPIVSEPMTCNVTGVQKNMAIGSKLPNTGSSSDLVTRLMDGAISVSFTCYEENFSGCGYMYGNTLITCIHNVDSNWHNRESSTRPRVLDLRYKYRGTDMCVSVAREDYAFFGTDLAVFYNMPNTGPNYSINSRNSKWNVFVKENSTIPDGASCFVMAPGVGGIVRYDGCLTFGDNYVVQDYHPAKDLATSTPKWTIVGLPVVHGWSGAPVFLNMPSTVALLGVVYAADVAKKVAYIHTLPDEFIGAMLMPDARRNVLMPVLPHPVAAVAGPIQPGSISKHIVDDPALCFRVCGSAPADMQASASKSRLVESKMDVFNGCDDIDLVVPDFRPKKHKLGDGSTGWTDSHLNFLCKLSKNMYCTDMPLIRAAQADLLDDLKKVSLKGLDKMYGMREALHGDGKFLKSLNWKASAGPTFKGRKKSECVSGGSLAHPDLVLTAEVGEKLRSDLEAMFTFGDVTEPLYQSSLKDEPLSSEKNANNKHRIFNGSDIVDTCHIRMGFGAFFAWLREHLFETECVVGMDALGKDFDRLAKILMAFVGDSNGLKVAYIDGDYVGFETRNYLLCYALEVIISLCACAGLPEPSLRYMRLLSHRFHSWLTVLRGELYNITNTTPSGVGGTAYFNCLSESLMQRMGWLRSAFVYYLVNGKNMSYDELRRLYPYSKYNCNFNFGDDNIRSVRIDEPWMHPEALRKQKILLGFDETPADKLAPVMELRNLFGVSILKRKFVVSPSLGIVGVLERKSLLKRFMFTERNGIADSVKYASICDSFEREVARTTLEEYNVHMNDLFVMLKKIEFHYVPIGFGVLQERYLSSSVDNPYSVWVIDGVVGL